MKIIIIDHARERMQERGARAVRWQCTYYAVSFGIRSTR